MTVTKPPLDEYYARYAPRTHGLPPPIPKYEFPRGREFYRRIGEPKRVVAPMVELGDLAWRIMARRYGAELCYTPMIHARLYSRPQTGQAFRQKHFSTRPDDRPLIAQFCANDRHELLAAAEMLQDQCDAIDLNLGCPQGIAKKGFYGSFLQDEWDLIYDMISTLHINLRIPVCAKMRIFNDRQKTIAYAKHICSAGVSILTVHGRTREMKGQKTGLADWDVIREIRENIPPEVVMFANGNIQYQGDVERCVAATGVDGVMSAEGHLYNPAIFLDPAASVEARHPRIDVLAREYLAIVKEIDDPMSNVAVKAHLFKIFRVALEVHKDLRGTLGISHGFEEWERCVGIMEERIDKALKEESREVVGIPWYRCQPYLRPERERERETAPKENEKCNISSEGASALEVVG